MTATPTPDALDATLLERAAADQARPLLVLAEPEETVTVGEFAREAGRAAAALAAQGIGAGDRIAVWAENGAPWLVLLAAAAWRGAALVTLHPGSGAQEVAEGLRRSGAARLFAADSIRGSDTAEVVRALPGPVTVFDPGLGSAALGGLEGSDGPEPPPAATPDAVLNIQFTSGSTGAPKMVALPAASLLRNARWTARAAGIGADDRLASPLPLAHAAGLGSGALLALVTGASWVSPRRFRPDTVLDQIDRHRCTVLQAVPTMAAMLADRVEERPARWDLSSLRLGFLGGAFCPPALCRRATRVLGVGRFAIVYGQTESAPTISVDLVDGAKAVPGSVGRPLPEVEVRVTDPGTGGDVPAGQEGELLVRSGALAAGYVDDPDATAAAFLPDGWLRTGDRARQDDAGRLVLTGRTGEMIIRGGENVSPAEVQQVLVDQPGIAQACVVGVPSPRWGEEVGALLVAAPGAEPDVGRILREAAGRLARFKVPTRVRVVAELPLLPSGKADGAAAAALLSARAEGEEGT